MITGRASEGGPGLLGETKLCKMLGIWLRHRGIEAWRHNASQQELGCCWVRQPQAAHNIMLSHGF